MPMTSQESLTPILRVLCFGKSFPNISTPIDQTLSKYTVPKKETDVLRVYSVLGIVLNIYIFHRFVKQLYK